MNSNDREMFANDAPRSFQRSLRPTKHWHEIEELEDEEELSFED